MSIPQKKVRGKRPTKPRRTLPGIAAVFSAGRWRWRACVTVRVRGAAGEPVARQATGPLRETQREAFDDVDGVRARALERAGAERAPTIGEALQAAIDRKRAQGLPPHSVHGDARVPAKAVLDRFRAEARLDAITPAMLCRWIEDQALAGIAPSTIRKKRLAILDLAFRVAGIPSPVPAARETMRAVLRPRDVEIPAFTPEELRDLLARARAWRQPQGRPTPRRELDVLLLELAATTGIRHDELARIRVCDVHLERGTITVTPKVRRRTREEPIVPEIRERLAARIAELAGKPPETYIVPANGRVLEHEPPWGPQARYLDRARERWQRRLGEPRLHWRALRRAHGTALDHRGAPVAVLRDALGHTRTSQETMRYLFAGRRAVTEAKHGLASHLLPPPAQATPQDAAPPAGDGPQDGGPRQ